MRLIDLDEKIIVPIHDEERDIVVETEMTIAEMFDRFMDGFCPTIIDAIPLDWLYDKRFLALFSADHQDDRKAIAIDIVQGMWEEENPPEGEGITLTQFIYEEFTDDSEEEDV